MPTEVIRPMWLKKKGEDFLTGLMKGKMKRCTGGDLGFDFSNAGYDVERATQRKHLASGDSDDLQIKSTGLDGPAEFSVD